MSVRPIILAFCEYYAPGFRAGGPIRAVQNLVDRLGDRFAFRIVARDRDLNDREPYRDVPLGRFTARGAAEVLYVPPSGLGLAAIRKLIASTPHDAVYLNSLVSPRFSIAPVALRRAGLTPARPWLLAPRGELGGGALAVKPLKKRLFLTFARITRLHRGVRFQATKPDEVTEILTRIHPAAHVDLAPDLAAAEVPEPRATTKVAGRARVVFLSRLGVMKNLDGAIEILRGVSAFIDFDVFGPADDPAYAASCEAAARTLPSNIRVAFRGPVPPERVGSTLAGYDLFFLPTRGENFGHAIVEALAAGCPVLISDRTPWRGLESNAAGWDVPLEAPGRFREILERVAGMVPEEHARWSLGARAVGIAAVRDDASVARSREMFESLLRERPPR